MMNRHILSLLLLATLISCTHREHKLEESHTLLPSLYIELPPEELEAILSDFEYKVPAHALLLSVDKDTLFYGELDHIKTRGSNNWK